MTTIETDENESLDVLKYRKVLTSSNKSHSTGDDSFVKADDDDDDDDALATVPDTAPPTGNLGSLAIIDQSSPVQLEHHSTDGNPITLSQLFSQTPGNNNNKGYIPLDASQERRARARATRQQHQPPVSLFDDENEFPPTKRRKRSTATSTATCDSQTILAKLRANQPTTNINYLDTPKGQKINSSSSSSIIRPGQQNDGDPDDTIPLSNVTSTSTGKQPLEDKQERILSSIPEEPPHRIITTQQSDDTQQINTTQVIPNITRRGHSIAGPLLSTPTRCAAPTANTCSSMSLSFPAKRTLSDSAATVANSQQQLLQPDSYTSEKHDDEEQRPAAAKVNRIPETSSPPKPSLSSSSSSSSSSQETVEDHNEKKTSSQDKQQEQQYIAVVLESPAIGEDTQVIVNQETKLPFTTAWKSRNTRSRANSPNRQLLFENESSGSSSSLSELDSNDELISEMQQQQQEGKISNGYRVLAYWAPEQRYYAASLKRYKSIQWIQFEDAQPANIDQVGMDNIRPLDLRIGDHVKFSTSKRGTYEITGFQKSRSLSVCEKTCIRGNHMVECIAVGGTRKKKLSSNTVYTYPIKDIYVPQSIFASTFKDRQSVNLEFLQEDDAPASARRIKRTPTKKRQSKVYKKDGLDSSSSSSSSSSENEYTRQGTPLVPLFEGTVSIYRQANAMSSIFAGILFSISKTKHQDKIRKEILINGGSICDDGFRDLFQCVTGGDDDEIIWKPIHHRLKKFKFACVVTDDYSRTEKYLQGLSLNWPCLAAEPFISDSLRMAISPPPNWHRCYLLAAGLSSSQDHHQSSSSGSTKFIKSFDISNFLSTFNSNNKTSTTTLEQQFENRPLIIPPDTNVILVYNNNASSFSFLLYAMGVESPIITAPSVPQALNKRSSLDPQNLCIILTMQQQQHNNLIKLQHIDKYTIVANKEWLIQSLISAKLHMFV